MIQSVANGYIGEKLQAQLFELIWQETSGLRRTAHGGRCPTGQAPYGEIDPLGVKIAEVCRMGRCLDLVHDVYTSVTPRLRERMNELREGTSVNDAVRYAHRTVRNRVADLRRSERSARGLPAKPSRTDGVPGRVIEALRAQAAEPEAAQWFSALFRLIRCYACGPGSPDRGWPLDFWTAEKVDIDKRPREVGTQVSRREISDDVAMVVATARTVAGSQWVYENIVGPMRTGSEPVSIESLHLDSSSFAVIASSEEVAEIGLVQSKFMEYKGQGFDAEAALSGAVSYVYGRVSILTTGDLDEIVEMFEYEVNTH